MDINIEIINRISKFIEEMNMNPTIFAKESDMDDSNFRKVLKHQMALSDKNCIKIAKRWNLNLEWIMSGNGEMRNYKIEKESSKIPFYSETPVSGGNNDIPTVVSNAVGCINIPGVIGKYAFKLIGCSMEPKIYAGDIVCVTDCESNENFDPDNIHICGKIIFCNIHAE